MSINTSPPFTRGDMKAIMRGQLQETVGTVGDGDPFGLDFLLTVAADLEASAVGAWYLPYYMDIVANQVDYAWPDGLQRLVTSMAYTAESTNVSLTIYTASEMDHVSAYWQVNPSTGDPNILVQKGGNRFQLYPIPNFSSNYDPTTFVGGMSLSGWGVPAGSWSGNAAYCPLPSFGQYAVIYRALVSRCLQYPDDPQYASRLPGFESLYRQAHGLFESTQATLTDGARHRDDKTAEGYGFYASNPLDNYL